MLRSDEQRSVKQKERKERELEHCSFNPERLEEQGAPLSMVRMIRAKIAMGNFLIAF